MSVTTRTVRANAKPSTHLLICGEIYCTGITRRHGHGCTRHNERLGAAELSTRVEYMYRDGANYKKYRTVIFEGDITDAQRETIQSNLADHDGFLPEQVGLEVLYTEWSSHYDDDHPWHELTSIDVIDGPSYEDQTIAEFAAKFEGITWDLRAATAAQAQWIAGTPVGR